MNDIHHTLPAIAIAIAIAIGTPSLSLSLSLSLPLAGLSLSLSLYEIYLPMRNSKRKTPPPRTLIPAIGTLLNACKTIGNLEQIHAQIIQKGLEQDNFLITQFVRLCNSFLSSSSSSSSSSNNNRYSSSSILRYASSVFNRVLQPNDYLWNAIIKGHCDKSSVVDTIRFFNFMKRSSKTLPDKFTFPSLIKVCSSESAITQGKAIHASVIKYGVDTDIYVRTSLIDFYGKCGVIQCARKVFDDDISQRNVVTWTAMINGYGNLGQLEMARKLFDQMPCTRNVASWNAMISGYAKFGSLKAARELFDDMPERTVVSFTSLIDGYSKAGDMASARYLFDQTPNRDIVAWSALISGYVQNGRPYKAVEVFREMMNAENVKPDEFIVVALMSACSQAGDLQLAEQVHSYISRINIDFHRVHVAAAFIDMNAKCGNMERATALFDKLPKRDLISYCSMIQGLSINRCADQAVRLFSRMLEEGLAPDEVAFTVILTACSHAGLVEEGCQYFKLMKNDYSIVPSSDHYACMVNLLGRAGRLKEACELIKSMPWEPHAGVWGALLWACRIHSNVELGKIVAGRLFELEPQSGANYVLLSNIYAAANRWSEVSETRSRMIESGVKKKRGCTWIWLI